MGYGKLSIPDHLRYVDVPLLVLLRPSRCFSPSLDGCRAAREGDGKRFHIELALRRAGDGDVETPAIWVIQLPGDRVPVVVLRLDLDGREVGRIIRKGNRGVRPP